MMKEYSSLDVAKAAVKVSMTSSRSEEEQLVQQLKTQGIHATAVDIGGNLIQSIPKIIERAIIASRKTHITKESFVLDGAVAGAAHRRHSRIGNKRAGLTAKQSRDYSLTALALVMLKVADKLLFYAVAVKQLH